MKDSLPGGFSDIGSNIKTGNGMIFCSDAVLQPHNQVAGVLLFSLIHGKIIFHVPFGDDQKVPIGNWITILYRNDRLMFGDDAVFDVMVTKRAIFHWLPSLDPPAKLLFPMPLQIVFIGPENFVVRF